MLLFFHKIHECPRLSSTVESHWNGDWRHVELWSRSSGFLSPPMSMWRASYLLLESVGIFSTTQASNAPQPWTSRKGRKWPFMWQPLLRFGSLYSWKLTWWDSSQFPWPGLAATRDPVWLQKGPSNSWHGETPITKRWPVHYAPRCHRDFWHERFGDSVWNNEQVWMLRKIHLPPSLFTVLFTAVQIPSRNPIRHTTECFTTGDIETSRPKFTVTNFKTSWLPMFVELVPHCLHEL